VKHVAFLLNPAHFPHNLFARALQWAQDRCSSFKVVVITDEKFGVDTESHDNGQHNDTLNPLLVEGHKINVIIRQVKFIREQVASCNLHFSSRILVQPRVSDVLTEIKLADTVFLEFNHQSGSSSFDWQELFHHIPVHKQVISNKVHG
jgi:hypothetical protein